MLVNYLSSLKPTNVGRVARKHNLSIVMGCIKGSVPLHKETFPIYNELVNLKIKELQQDSKDDEQYRYHSDILINEFNKLKNIK